MGLNGVDSMTVGTDGRKAVTLGDGLAVGALVEGAFDVGVAFAAGGGDIEFIDGRLGVVGGNDGVCAMAVSADGGLG
jgi:hypothetical protein